MASCFSEASLMIYLNCTLFILILISSLAYFMSSIFGETRTIIDGLNQTTSAHDSYPIANAP